jgi:GntR family transcriptional regulator
MPTGRMSPRTASGGSTGALNGPGRPPLRYEQVMRMIERLIVEGGLAPGDVLPTNKELAAMASVSLISVRRALDELERAGRVRRHQGVGTFVAAERIFASPARAGGLVATLTGDTSAPKVDTQILEVSQGLPTDDIAASLELGPRDLVWRIRRLRVIGARPMISEQSVIPVRLAPGLDSAGLRHGASLYDLLASQHGLTDAFEEQYLDITVPAPADRKVLRLTARDRVARIRGVSFSHDGTPFDCFQQVYPADGFAFYLSGRTDRHVLPVGTATAGRKAWNVVPAAARA